jgi:ATP-dependent Clp protease ATP-binding subunit ClpA
MSENAAETAPAEKPAESKTEAPAQETDWKAMARKWEAQAKANKDAADELAKIKDSQKTEAQKAADRLAALEKKAAEAEAKAIRAEVAAEKGVPVALLSGSTREDLEAAADALIAFRGEQKPAGPSSSAISKANTGQNKGTTADQFADFISTQLQ